MAFKTFLYRKAIDLAMGRPAPSRFTLSGDEAKKHNFYEVRLFEPGQQAGFLVIRATKAGAWVLPFNERREELPECEIPSQDFENYNLWIRHYYQGYSILTQQAWLFILQQASFYPFFATRKERFTQAIYNLRPLSRKERYELLRYMVKRTLDERDYKTSSIRLLDDTNPFRAMRHPSAIDAMSHYDLVLRSLAHAGDLTRVGGDTGDYRISDQALTTLTQYDLEERRYRESNRQQKWLVGLTVAVVFMGAVQAAATYWAAGDGPPNPIRALWEWSAGSSK